MIETLHLTDVNLAAVVVFAKRGFRGNFWIGSIKVVLDGIFIAKAFDTPYVHSLDFIVWNAGLIRISSDPRVTICGMVQIQLMANNSGTRAKKQGED